MVKRTEISDEKRQRVLSLRREGLSYAKIKRAMPSLSLYMIRKIITGKTYVRKRKPRVF